MASALSIPQCQRQLLRSYEQLAKVDSHCRFVTTCQRSHTIPWGLKINVRPCVPKVPCREPVAHLQKEWAQVIKRATWGFLASLRTYHRSCAHHLRLQATNLESSIVTWLGKTNGMTAINTAKSIYDQWYCHLWERQNKKLKKPLLLNSRINTITYQAKKDGDDSKGDLLGQGRIATQRLWDRRSW